MANELLEELGRQQSANAVTTEATEMVESVETPEAVVESQTETVESTNAEMATSTTTEEVEAPETQAAEAVDYNGWLKEQSGGLFDNVDTFKSSLDKFKNYDEKVTKITELEKNQLPEDDFIKQVATLRGAGATKDQLTEFVRLNTEFEDFSTMTPEQLKISKMVLIDGYSKEVATRKVNREFDVTDFEEGSDEYNDVKEELRISSKEDLKSLESYKAKISTVENKAEQEKLNSIHIKSAHEQNVKQTIPTIIEKFNGLGEFSLKGTLGKEEVTSDLKFDFDDDFKSKIPAMLETYFNTEIAPITEESIKDANNYVKATYLANNIDKLLENAYKSGLAKGNEKTEDKYVNPKGVEETVLADTNASSGAGDMQAWAERKFNGGR